LYKSKVKLCGPLYSAETAFNRSQTKFGKALSLKKGKNVSSLFYFAGPISANQTARSEPVRQADVWFLLSFIIFQEYTTMAQSIWMKRLPFWPELVINILLKNCLANLSN